MAWLSLIVEGLKAVPALLDLLKRLGAAARANDLAGDLSALEGAVNDLEKAHTTEDKLAAARKLLDVHKRL